LVIKRKVCIADTCARLVYLLSFIGPYSNLSPSQCSKGLERVLVLLLTSDGCARPASNDKSPWNRNVGHQYPSENNCVLKVQNVRFSVFEEKKYRMCRRPTSKDFSLIQSFGLVCPLSSLLPLSMVWWRCDTQHCLLLKVQRSIWMSSFRVKHILKKVRAISMFVAGSCALVSACNLNKNRALHKSLSGHTSTKFDVTTHPSLAWITHDYHGKQKEKKSYLGHSQNITSI